MATIALEKSAPPNVFLLSHPSQCAAHLGSLFQVALAKMPATCNFVKHFLVGPRHLLQVAQLLRPVTLHVDLLLEQSGLTLDVANLGLHIRDLTEALQEAAVALVPASLQFGKSVDADIPAKPRKAFQNTRRPFLLLEDGRRRGPFLRHEGTKLRQQLLFCPGVLIPDGSAKCDDRLLLQEMLHVLFNLFALSLQQLVLFA
mmetsp:Transcript_65876/g.121433  ORF Transcript_65876/g.121433 Transcript_65876/m.121433 type:complete len:201 (-) Transcript_65876:923-1525(-)